MLQNKLSEVSDEVLEAAVVSGEVPAELSISNESATDSDNSESTTENVEETKDNKSESLKDSETLEASGDTEDKKESVVESDAPKKETHIQKEEARKAKSWKALQEDKEAWKAEKEKERKSFEDFTNEQKRFISEQLEQIKKVREEMANEKAEREFKGSPESYERIAKDAEARGDTRLAEEARLQAAYLREKASEKAAFESARKKQIDEQERNTWAQKAVAELPELKDQNSAEFKEAVDILSKNSDLASLPRAHWFAAQFAKAQKTIRQLTQEVSKVSEKDVRISELETELNSLKKNLSPSSKTSASPLTKPSHKTEVSDDELDKLVVEKG